jgi:HK97 family phage major capsid protein
MAGKTLYIPGEDGTVTVVYTDEAVAATESNPTFRQVPLTAVRLDAFGVMSSEVQADAQIDLVSNVFEQYAQAIAVQLDSDLFVGTSPFTGIKTAASVNLVTMAAGDDEFADIDAIYYSEMIGALPVNKLGNAEFYFGRTIGHRTRSLSDTTGQLIWGQFASGEPNTIYGYPVNTSDAFPADSNDEMAVVFGDLKRVALGIRQGMEFSIDPYGLWTSSQIRTKVTMRVAMVVAQPDGLVRLFTIA